MGSVPEVSGRLQAALALYPRGASTGLRVGSGFREPFM